MNKLNKLLVQETMGANADAQLLKIKAGLNRFHIIQISLFVIVFTLSVFKFN